MSWHEELDREMDDAIVCRNKIEKMQYDYDVLAVANADNIRKAHRVFRCLRHIEEHTMKCPTCSAERDEDGILAHSRKCYLADTLEKANDN